MVEHGGAKIVVDKISMDFLSGATLNYKEQLIGSAFHIEDNPNAVGSCGCKFSFTPKD